MKARHLTSRIVVISTILIVCAYYVGRKSGRGFQARYDAILAHHAAVKNCMRLGEEVSNRIAMACRRNISIADFENDFGSVTSIDPAAEYPYSVNDATHFYMHPESYCTYYLHFRDGALIHMGANLSPDGIRPHLPSIEERISRIL